MGAAAGRRGDEGERAVALTWIRTHDWDVDAWRMRSACLDSDPDVFFPIGTTGGALEQIETAKRICTACLVTDECLEFALATNQEAGIWGGTTEEDRRKLRKAWLAQQRTTA
jgi:WhiB family transcriptional regulator, redox-sensing transcriptional regulator